MATAPRPSPDFAQALAWEQAGRTAEASAVYRALAAGNPPHLGALAQLAHLAQRQGRGAEAVVAWQRLAALAPAHPEAQAHLGLALRAVGREEEAVVSLRRSLALKPEAAEVRHQLGNALRRLGRLREAAAELERAARLSPDQPLLQLNLGSTLLDLDLPTQAVEVLRRAVQLAPAMAEARNIFACALLAAGQAGAARAELAEALRLRPDYAAAYNNLARTYRAQGRVAEALQAFDASLALAPSAATASNRLMTMLYLEHPPGVVESAHRAWAAQFAEAAVLPTLAHTHTPIPSPTLSPSPTLASLAEAQATASRSASTSAYTPALAPVDASASSPASAQRRLRVGYLSADFCRHAVAFFLEPVLVAHDRAAVEVFCYQTRALSDDVTQRMRAAVEHWREVATLGDAELARVVRADLLDVLVELNGHTAGHRLPVLAGRLAPVQVTWLGYPATTGLAAIDYRVTDALCLPPINQDLANDNGVCGGSSSGDGAGGGEGSGVDDNDASRQGSEKLLRLAPVFCCYQPPAEAPPVAEWPAAPGIEADANEPVGIEAKSEPVALTHAGTFAASTLTTTPAAGPLLISCNNLAKLSPATLALWARILAALPTARLRLCSPGADDAETQAWLRQGLAAGLAGVAAAVGAREEGALAVDEAEAAALAARIEFDGARLPVRAHLERYREAAVALDPFPYNGTTTTCEALLMGVPVVTLAGTSHVSRVGVSLLHAVGCPELVATTPDAYVARVVALVADGARRRELRRTLRGRLLDGPLGRTREFTRRWEAVLQELGRR